MDSEQQKIVPNIVTEDTTRVNSSPEKKARNRMVAEGYKYHVLEDNDGTSPLDPIKEERKKIKSKRLRRIVYLLAFSIVAITCLVVVIIIQHFRNQKTDGTCKARACVTKAAYIMNKMDTSVDPCEDFYTYSCGSWVQNTNIPPSKAKYGSFSQLGDEIQIILRKIIEEPGNSYKGTNSSAIEKAKNYYNMCIDENRINKTGNKPALQLIHELGRWTLTSDETSGTFDPDRWSIQDSVLLLHRLEFSPLFQMVVVTDDRNSSRHIIGFEQSGLSLGDPRDYFTNHTTQKELKSAFVEFGQELVALLGNRAGDVEQAVTDIYDLEQQLAQIFVPKEELQDPVKNYNKMTLQEFQDDYLGDWLDIKEYLDGMFADIGTYPMDTEVIVYTPKYFQELNKLMADVKQETLANYMVWHGVTSLTGYLTDDFMEVALKLDHVETGLKEYPPRWKRCLGKTLSSFGFALGALYVQDNFDVTSKKEVESLFEEIREAFISNLDTVSWMDAATKAYATKKAEAVQKHLGFPDYILDPMKLDNKYENVTLVAGKFFESKLEINRFYRLKNLWKYAEVPDRTEWNMYPSEVNGYYSSDFNQIVFPAGILRPPLYNSDAPKSFNFGSFGMISGHELTHGFDNRGRRFDLDGNMREWWSNTSAQNFEQQSKCFIDFYHNYTVAETHLDGETTLSENIADNGGMRVAFLAYENWKSKHDKDDTLTLPGLEYTGEQLFFIGMAQIWCSKYTAEYEQQAILVDEHSISKFRVLGSMSNSEQFATAFSCPVGSPMNPQHKCRVW